MKRIKPWIRRGLLGISIPLMLSCSEGDIKENVRTLAQSSELSSVEYTITKVVKADDNTNWSIGDRKILFSCKAIVKAGVDLSLLTDDDIQIDQESKKADITLPAPQILSFNMPVEDAKLVYEKVGPLRFNFSVEERNKLLVQGEEAIRTDLERLGILNDAKENTKMFFRALLQQFGYENVKISFKEKKEEA